MEKKFRLLLLLALLLTAATGAWAQTETLLTTIESTVNTSFYSGSKTFDDKVTVTFSDEVYNDGDNMGWFSGGDPSLLTVAGTNGYTITSCKFYTDEGTAATGYTVEGKSPSVYIIGGNVYTDANESVYLGSQGITKIEVFGTAASGYTVSMKDNVKDADKWTVKVGDGQAQALPIGGLTGDGSETVTLQYTGRLKVKGVKATSDAAAPSVPDGALSGKFSVSDGKQVYFSKGNLRYESSKWSFFDNQYDYYTSYSADAWDHFGWSTSATDYGKNTSTTRSDYSGDFVDWGATMGTGWRMLTSDEWTYLLKTRSASTVNGTENGRYAKAKVNDVRGVILFPDTYTHPDGVTAPTGVNDTGNTGWNGNSYTAADWTKMETAGCVFLPAAGYRNGSMVNNPGSVGDYSSATPSGTEKAYELYFSSGSLNTASEGSRFYGLSVRLVCEAATSDAEPAAATPLDNTTTAWTAGTFAVPAGGLTYSDAITVSGDVTLTLTDGETLTLNKGISLASGATLTIQGNGAMVVNGTNNSTASTVAGSTGTLILTSGTLTATGGYGGNTDYGAYDSHGGNGGDAINGSVIVSGGTLTATGGNGGNSSYGGYNTHGGNGGDAINGSVTVSGGTLTARGGNGGSAGEYGTYCSGGKGGDAISGTLTINGGSTSVNDGSNGSIGSGCDSSTAGTGGKGHN